MVLDQFGSFWPNALAKAIARFDVYVLIKNEVCLCPYAQWPLSEESKIGINI